jgi:hypothetical protein
MDFDDLIRELAPPPNRVGRCSGDREHHLDEGAVVAAFATAPYFSTGGVVIEHATNGTVVGALKAVDLDAGYTATWSLIDNAGGRFALSASGQVTMANGSLLNHGDAHRHLQSRYTHRDVGQGQ